MGKAGELIMDLVYPKRCPFCGSVRAFGSTAACGECVRRLKRVKPPVCFRCGKHIADEEEEYCGDCNDVPKTYVRGYPVFDYTDDIKEALYAFKYRNQRDYGTFFADCIWEVYREELSGLGVDGVVPVPIHRKKKKVRGFNQAELLGRHLSERLSVPIYPDYLIRCVNTNPQKELNDRECIKNQKNAFKIGSNTIELKKVLLVDDIYTTGATIEACTQVLRDAGVREVYYTSVAIGQGFGDIKEDLLWK